MRAAKIQSNGNYSSGFFEGIENRRAELLGAALIIWRWGRQNAANLETGRPLGGFEKWSEWCRDPLLALACRDPIDRLDRVKSDDPERRWIVDLFEAWETHHGERSIKAADLAEPVRALIDPQRRGRQYAAARVNKLRDTRAGGFVLTRQEPTGKWGAATYALRRT